MSLGPGSMLRTTDGDGLGWVEPQGAAPAARADAPIDRLVPGSPQHQNMLDHLKRLLTMSQREMAKFHTRWRSAELQYQAYLSTKTVEELKKAGNNRGIAPELVTITVPYSYSAVQTVVTYLLHTFCGRKPLFHVGTYRGDNVQLGRNMETVLQYNADHVRLIRKLYQFFLDGEIYGLQVMRSIWKVEERRKTTWKEQRLFGLPPVVGPSQETAITFEGNDVQNIDPFRFYPDPRVPMDEVSEKGEFVFWQTKEGRHSLAKAQDQGLIKWVERIQDMQVMPGFNGGSERGRLAEGHDEIQLLGTGTKDFVWLTQGTVEIQPSKWGLGSSSRYEKWLFTIANGNTIIQAEPLDADHDKHPVIVGEPLSAGYGFGNMSMTDMLGPFQDLMSWMINSHIFNVRAVLNNTLVVNPQLVDMEDLKKPGPGRVIKLKPQAFGQDMKNAIYQLQVQDITRSHLTDLTVVNRFADLVSSTNDNLRGVVQAGGRKTATEVRTSGEAGASRLAARARLISAQSICPAAEMWTINLQQNMSQAVYLQLLGADAMEAPLPLGPEQISGDFYFPVHDGTLPLDRVALLDVWKEIFLALVSNPQLGAGYDVPGIFEYVAELGGAKNITQFKVQTMPNAAVAGASQAGNVIPMPQAAAALAGGGGRA